MTFDKLYSILCEANDLPKIIGLIGVTNDEGTAYMFIRKGQEIYQHDDLYTNNRGNHAAIIFARKSKWSNDNAIWRYAYLDNNLYVWEPNLSKKECIEKARIFLEDKIKVKVNRIRPIIHDDSGYDISHFVVTESFYAGVKSFIHGKDAYAEIFKNPSMRELKQLSENNTVSIGTILTSQDAYIWNRNEAFHYAARKEIKDEGISAILTYNNNFNKCYVTITDNTKNTQFYHKPCRDFIVNHPYMKKFQILEVSYFDEDIVGSWDKMAE